MKRTTGASLSLTRRSLMQGTAAALALLGTARIALAQDGTKVLRAIHDKFKMDWSPMRGGDTNYRWNSFWWASPMYFDAEGTVQPYVVASWDSNPEATEWTLVLNPDATFSDGSPITAEDIKGSWELGAMPSTRNQRVDQVLGTVQGFAEISQGAATDLPGVVVVDAGTLKVTLSSPDFTFFMKIANHLVPIVKAAQARDANGEEVPDWWMPDMGGVVSGPFMPDVIDLDLGELSFKANPAFFGPKPALDRIELRVVEDAVTATTMLQNGEADAHTEIVTSTLIDDLGEGFVSGPFIPKGQHFWFNAFRAPFDDPKVRAALILAVDRQQLIDLTFPKGPHAKADQILNAVPGMDPDFEPYAFDPERAKQLLAESTYGSADRLPKILVVGVSNPATATAAQFILEQWRQHLGITAVDMKPQIDAYSGPDQGSVQVFRDDVGTRVPDAATYLMGAIHSSSGNAQNKLGGYKDAQVDQLLDEAALLKVDDPERDAKAREAQRIFRDQFLMIPWYHEVMSQWAMPQVKGFTKNLDWQVIEPWAVTVEA